MTDTVLIPAVSSTVGGRLQGKVAIVTGASNGAGAASATSFAREGARVRDR